MLLSSAAWCGTWSEAGVHPYAAAQATAGGKLIRVLAAWNGKLYSGYGDDGANSGPIHLLAFDPVTRNFTDEWTCQTEEIAIFRPMLGRLYALADDPRDPAAAAYAVTSPGGLWSDKQVNISGGFDVAHNFDMATMTGSDLWLVGSAYQQGTYPGAVFRSQDGGATWDWIIARAKTGSDTLEAYVRFYWAGTLNHKLYIQCNEETHSRVFDGSVWNSGPDIANTASTAYNSAPFAFAGKLVSRKNWAFDGSAKYSPIDPGCADLLRDIARSGNTLYFLYSHSIRRTTDLASFSTVTTHPFSNSATSLAVLNGKLYVGTAYSKIFEYSDPVSTLPSVAVLVTDANADARVSDTGTFTIKRFDSLADPLTVGFSLSGSAQNGVDYQMLPTSAVIPAGADSITFSVVPTTDSISGSLFVSLPESPHYEIAAPSDGLILITDRLGTPCRPEATNTPAFSEMPARVFPNPMIKGKTAGQIVRFDGLLPDSVIRIYTVEGTRRASLENGALSQVGWDASNEAGGVYVYVIRCGHRAQKGKFSLVK